MNGEHRLASAAGFRCEVCELSFSNNIKHAEHLTTSLHRTRANIPDVRPSTLMEVKSRIEKLAKERGLSSKESPST